MTPVLEHTHLILSHIRNDIEPDKLMSVGIRVLSFLADFSFVTSNEGIHAYEAACEEWDNAVKTQLTEYTAAVEDSQNRIKALFTELRSLEERREQWWMRCNALIEQAGQFVTPNIQPRLIARLLMGVYTSLQWRESRLRK